jgi:hypothetical protein
MPKSTTLPDAVSPRHGGDIAAAFTHDESMGIRNAQRFQGCNPPAYSLACLRIDVVVAFDAARLAASLLATLWLGGTFTRWTTIPNFESLPHCFSPFRPAFPGRTIAPPQRGQVSRSA